MNPPHPYSKPEPRTDTIDALLRIGVAVGFAAIPTTVAAFWFAYLRHDTVMAIVLAAVFFPLFVAVWWFIGHINNNTEPGGGS